MTTIAITMKILPLKYLLHTKIVDIRRSNDAYTSCTDIYAGSNNVDTAQNDNFLER